MVPERIGPYRVTRLIGQGGMGFVYEAVQEPIARRVAVKVLRPEFAVNRSLVERFFNEARTVNLIEHPNVVQITDFGQAPDGTIYIAMEYLRGESLEQRLQRLAEKRERLPVQQVLHVAQQVAEALSAAHEKGIVHRDLKPDNIMLVPESSAHGGERIKILDFGIAKLMSSGHQYAGTTLTQQVLGTPTYMSPEQCRGAGKVDERTDVYSLGVIMYRMLAGRAPFVAQGPGEIIAMQLREEAPPLTSFAPETPPELVELVHRLLIKDRELRPEMRDVLDALEQLLSELQVADSLVEIIKTQENEVVPSMPPSASTISRSGWQARAKLPLRGGLGLGVGVGIAVVALGTVALFLLRTPKRPPLSAVPVAPPAAAVTTTQQPVTPPAPKAVTQQFIATQPPTVRPELAPGATPRKPVIVKPQPRPAVKSAPAPAAPSKKTPEVTYVD